MKKSRSTDRSIAFLLAPTEKSRFILELDEAELEYYYTLELRTPLSILWRLLLEAQTTIMGTRGSTIASRINVIENPGIERDHFGECSFMSIVGNDVFIYGVVFPDRDDPNTGRVDEVYDQFYSALAENTLMVSMTLLYPSKTVPDCPDEPIIWVQRYTLDQIAKFCVA
jgi:hypothetical protein